VGSTGSRAQGEHVRWKAGGRECDKSRKDGQIVIGGPYGRGGVKRGEGREATLSQAATGFTVEDGMLKGFSRGAAPGAERGSVPIKPGRMGCEVAFARPHLMEATGHELGEAHEGVGRERRWVGIAWGRRSE